MPSPFETAIGKLTALIGDDVPEVAGNAFAIGRAAANPWGTAASVMGNAMARGVRNEMSGVEPENRGAQMPIANWPDGPGLALPQTAIDSYNAMARFGRGENPQPQDAVLAGLATTGGIAMPRPAGSIGMAGRPRQMPEPGMLAEAGLTRMRAEDAVKPRPFPDAPQNLNELESYLQKNVDGNSRTRADEAWAEDPTRYNAYSHGMADVLNPESQWWKGEPTLQSGGSVAPAAATGSSEHHSRSQPRGAGGRFVGRDSFDGRLASLDKMMVDLDGDGVPDVAVPQAPGNAMVRMAQQTPGDRLQERGYLDQPPSASVMLEALGGDAQSAYEAYMRPRLDTLERIGVPPLEARRLIEGMPDVESYRLHLSEQGMTDPVLQEEIRKMLEDVR